MKTILLSFSIAMLCALLSGQAVAQTISVNSVSATRFCAGDDISVTFTVTGVWGHKNAFTLQLSDTSGVFVGGTFTNLGSIEDTVAGTFTISSVVPQNAQASTHYRIRILGAYPYTPSADNGADLRVAPVPTIDRLVYYSSVTPVVGTPIDMSVGSDDLLDTARHLLVKWNFGADATPATAIDTVPPYDTSHAHPGDTLVQRPDWKTVTHKSIFYSSTGLKTITVSLVSPDGCEGTASTQIEIYGCTLPAIAHSTIVIANDTQLFDPFGGRAYWIDPGMHVSFAGLLDTFYVEAGAVLTHTSGFNNTVYLKSGAAFVGAGGSSNWITYDSGASIVNANSQQVLCTGLHFDYTNAPPNKVFMGVATAAADMAAISVQPNPTAGVITVSEAPLALSNIQVLDDLGRIVAVPALPHTSEFSIDLRRLAAGTYYVRLVSPTSVTTRMVVKE